MDHKDLEKIIADKIWQHRADLRRAFIGFDTGRNGVVGFNDFVSGLQRFGCNLTETEMKLVFDAFDLHSQGTLNYNEFLSLVREPNSVIYEDQSVYVVESEAHKRLAKVRQVVSQYLMARHTSLIAAFLSLDINRNNYITRAELFYGLEKLNLTLPSEDLDLLVNTYDINGDGTFSYREFCTLMSDMSDQDISKTLLSGYHMHESGDDDHIPPVVPIPIPDERQAVLYDLSEYHSAEDQANKALDILSGMIKERELMLRELFDTWADKTKIISRKHLDEGLRKMGIALSRPALLRLEYVFGGKGNIRYSDFVRVISAVVPLEPVQSDHSPRLHEFSSGDASILSLIATSLYDRGLRIHQVFKKMDTSGTGFLTCEALREGISVVFNVQIPIEAVRHLVGVANRDSHSGSISPGISYHQFVRMISSGKAH